MIRSQKLQGGEQQPEPAIGFTQLVSTVNVGASYLSARETGSDSCGNTNNKLKV